MKKRIFKYFDEKAKKDIRKKVKYWKIECPVTGLPFNPSLGDVPHKFEEYPYCEGLLTEIVFADKGGGYSYWNFEIKKDARDVWRLMLKRYDEWCEYNSKTKNKINDI